LRRWQQSFDKVSSAALGARQSSNDLDDNIMEENQDDMPFILFNLAGCTKPSCRFLAMKDTNRRHRTLLRINPVPERTLNPSTISVWLSCHRDFFIGSESSAE
jgi:hypothetical protein